MQHWNSKVEVVPVFDLGPGFFFPVAEAAAVAANGPVLVLVLVPEAGTVVHWGIVAVVVQTAARPTMPVAVRFYFGAAVITSWIRATAGSDSLLLLKFERSSDLYYSPVADWGSRWCSNSDYVTGLLAAAAAAVAAVEVMIAIAVAVAAAVAVVVV